MNTQTAKLLKVGDKVLWDAWSPDTRVEGTVVEVGYCAAKVEWNDGQIGITHFEDMKRIELPQ